MALLTLVFPFDSEIIIEARELLVGLDVSGEE
jgi:hypothetical protein